MARTVKLGPNGSQTLREKMWCPPGGANTCAEAREWAEGEGSPQILFSRFSKIKCDKAAGGGDGSKASTVANGSQTLRKKMWWQMRVVKPAREAAAPERQPSDLALEKRLACGRSQSPRLCVCVILLFDDDLVD